MFARSATAGGAVRETNADRRSSRQVSSERGMSEPMSRAKETSNVTSRDRIRFARARARGEAGANDPSAVVKARYDESRDRIELTFGGGGLMAIPRKLIPELESTTTRNLKAIEVSLAGYALSW